MAAQVFRSAPEVALHVLKNHGPKTTHQLHKACLELPAPRDKPYIAPHHRDYRIRGDKLLLGTVKPPNPDHQIRSVRHLKITMQNLEAIGQVGHIKLERWIQDTERAGNEQLLEEAKDLLRQSETTKDSHYVWIHGDTFMDVRGSSLKAQKHEKKQTNKGEKKKRPAPSYRGRNN